VRIDDHLLAVSVVERRRDFERLRAAEVKRFNTEGTEELRRYSGEGRRDRCLRQAGFSGLPGKAARSFAKSLRAGRMTMLVGSSA